VHSLTDSSTDVAILLGSMIWLKPPDSDHPYGHRRIETFITLFIGLVLFAAGVSIAWDATASLLAGKHTVPGVPALVAALVSIVVKEGIARWTDTVGRSLQSPALRANAWHHRSDAISSIPVALAVTAALVRPSWAILDPIGAIVVALFIAWSAYRIIRPNVRELADAAAPQGVIEKIEIVSRSVEGVRGVHDIRTRTLAARVHVDLHVEVDATLTVEEGHLLAELVRERLQTECDELEHVLVHLDPLQSEAGDQSTSTVPE
ncbi:cation diffusion facilitator family transporter, partial [bacterium]|nr:cation diffusion facilitator family transporter [bacterium]